jgi:hypothetical protein
MAGHHNLPLLLLPPEEWPTRGQGVGYYSPLRL